MYAIRNTLYAIRYTIQSSIVVPDGTPIKLSFSIYLHFHFHFHLLLLETDLILDCTVQYCTVDSVYTE